MLARARAGFIGLKRAITGRGRAFVAAGVACLVAAQAIGERDLLRIGALLILLPLAALAVIARTRYRIELTRTVTPSRISVGAPARVLLHLENVSRLPSAVLLMEDTVPYALGGRPRFVLRQVEPSGVREAVYTIRPETRGRYEIGPLTVRLTDPFGCVELNRTFTSTEQITVTPPVQPLPPVALGGEGYAGGEGHAARAAVSGDADIATREYRQGDDLRRVHWRSTAKRGQLMVRRDEQPRQKQATLVLDTRASAHRGEGAGLQGSSFEWAVAAGASIAVWLARRGYVLQLITTGGLRASGGTPALAEANILELLSVVTGSPESAFGSATASLAPSIGGRTGGLVIAIVGVRTSTLTGGLDGLPPRPDTGLALAIDTDSWTTRGRAERDAAAQSAAIETATHLLAAGGWKVVSAQRGDALAELWPQAGTRLGFPSHAGMGGDR